MDDPNIVEAAVNSIKGVVKHQLQDKGENTALSLLRYCVLDALPTKHSSDIVRTQTLQKNLRNQYYRLMHQYPENKYAYTYALNCCPVGFLIEPITRFCNNPKACPWCFVRRRLYPIYLALHCIPRAIRKPCKVIAWQRTKIWNLQELPFFRSDYGPHQWCSALATVQLCVPFVDKGNLQVRHVGIQVVPADCNVRKQLTRLAVQPSLTFTTFEGGTNTNIVRAMATVLRVPWATLFASENLQSFYSLLARSDAHLLRITKYKQRGDIDGN